ncbi:HNH endonuclease, partial [Phormidium sp. CCY1219]|nr:HNH endonuclease [Phormidium sp. CCY1219]
MLKDTEEDSSVEKPEYRLKLGPGSKTTGIAILKENKGIWAAELNHRGFSIQRSLESRRSLGGSNRISNLTLSCVKCNQRKRNKPVEQFLKKKPELLNEILWSAKRP